MMSINQDFIKYLSNVGSSKKWFTKIYTFFLCGATYPLYIFMQSIYSPIISPLNDMLLFNRSNIIEKFKNIDEYTDAVFANDAYNYLNISKSNVPYDNLSSAISLNRRINNIIGKNIHFNNINSLIHKIDNKSTIQVTGLLYILKPLQPNQHNIGVQERELIAQSMLEINKLEYIYNATYSGIIIKDYNGVSIKCNVTLPPLPRINKLQLSDTIVNRKYESGVLQWTKSDEVIIRSDNAELQKQLQEYFNQIKSILPKNAYEVIICSDIVLGEFNGVGDEIFNSNTMVINHHIEQPSALEYNHPQLYKYINSQYNNMNCNNTLVDIIYQLNAQTLSIEAIQNIFDIVPITINININSGEIVMFEKNKFSLCKSHIHNNTIMLTQDIQLITPYTENQHINELEFCNNSEKAIKNRYLNIELNKNYEER